MIGPYVRVSTGGPAFGAAKDDDEMMMMMIVGS
jgi:hypothetical protein